MGMGEPFITLTPPTYKKQAVRYLDDKGEEKKLKLRLRVFTGADIGFIQALAGAEWYETLAETGNLEVAIEILAHQIDNEGEILRLMGETDLADGLKKFIPFEEGTLAGVLQMLVPLWKEALEGPQIKKRRRAAAKRRLTTGLILLLCASLGLAAGLYLSTML